ncbi:MAG: hypothetical protein PVH87_16125 [Desulfobacteraceae bacterium]|jgi:hypothetical protein
MKIHKNSIKKGVESEGKTKRGKGTRIMAITIVSGFPVAAHIESASPHEVELVEATIGSSITPNAPNKIIGDKAYDSDKLDKNSVSLMVLYSYWLFVSCLL